MAARKKIESVFASTAVVLLFVFEQYTPEMATVHHGHHGARLAIIRTHLRYAWSWLDEIEINLTRGPD